MRANTANSFLIFKERFTFFWRSIQAPIPAKTIKIEEKKNESSIVDVACSDTESVSMSCAIKNGFAAFRYLNDGKLSKPEEAIAIPATTVPPRRMPMLRRKDLPLIFLASVAITRNAVQPIMKNPLIFTAKVRPVLSYNAVTKINTVVKTMDVHTINLLSFLRNGSAMKKNPMGNIKNCIPPHEARPNARKIPPATIFARETFPLSDFMALITR